MVIAGHSSTSAPSACSLATRPCDCSRALVTTMRLPWRGRVVVRPSLADAASNARLPSGPCQALADEGCPTPGKQVASQGRAERGGIHRGTIYPAPDYPRRVLAVVRADHPDELDPVTSYRGMSRYG